MAGRHRKRSAVFVVLDSCRQCLGVAAAPIMIVLPMAPAAHAAEDSAALEPSSAPAPLELLSLPVIYEDDEPIDGLDDVEELYRVKYQFRI